MRFVELLERQDALYTELLAASSKTDTQCFKDRANELAHCNRQLARHAGPCGWCGTDMTVTLQDGVWACATCGREFSVDDVRAMARNRHDLLTFLLER